MRAVSTQAPAKCPECGISAGKHHDIGCPLPCDACKASARRRARRELRFAAGLGAAGFLGDVLTAVHWAAALVFGAALATGCLFAMGRQRWIEQGRKR